MRSWSSSSGYSTPTSSRAAACAASKSPSAKILVAEERDGGLAGTAIVLFRPRSAVARLYSIAVAPHMGGRGVASMLLRAAEECARRRRCGSIRLEVHETNHAAISRYRKSGYQEFGRRARYYEDGGDALRFEKPLIRRKMPRLADAPSANCSLVGITLRMRGD